MKKRLWLLVLEFLAITIPVAWLWIEWGRSAYLKFFLKLATPILMILGVSEFQPRLVQEHFLKPQNVGEIKNPSGIGDNA